MDEEFKIIFILGYRSVDTNNDNIDINIIFESGKVYAAVLATIENVITSLNGGDLYYWWSDLIIIKDLRKETIKSAIQATIKNGYFNSIFSEIGTIESIFKVNSFDKINDMNDIIEYTK